jgi:hypothetical protein
MAIISPIEVSTLPNVDSLGTNAFMTNNTLQFMAGKPSQTTAYKGGGSTVWAAMAKNLFNHGNFFFDGALVLNGESVIKYGGAGQLKAGVLHDLYNLGSGLNSPIYLVEFMTSSTYKLNTGLFDGNIPCYNEIIILANGSAGTNGELPVNFCLLSYDNDYGSNPTIKYMPRIVATQYPKVGGGTVPRYAYVGIFVHKEIFKTP